MAHGHRCDCCMTRRQCLKFISSAAIATGLTGEALCPAAAGPVAGGPEVVDIASLRPRPEVTISTAILRIPPPYWLGWPGTTYDLEKHSAEYMRLAGASGQKLGIHVSQEAAPIQDEGTFNAYLEKIRRTSPDAVLVVLQHMACWNWAERLSHEAGVPLIVFSPIGTSFTGHVLGISRRTGVHVVSSMEWSAVESAMRMVRAKRLFEETRVLWVQGDQRGETVLDRLGTKVRQVPRATFNRLFDKVGPTTEVKDIASDFRRHARKVVEPTWDDSVNSARALVTAKTLMAAEKANGLSMDCLGMVGAKLVPTPPCGAWTILQDHGITAGCEADLFGATSLMLSSYLLGRPGYMNDPVAETSRNLLVASHCTAGTRIEGFDKPAAPYILRDHSESSLGVSTQVIWPKDRPVTLVRFNGPDELIVDTGTVVGNVDTPPAGGCRTCVEIKMDRVEDARDVAGFHQVVTLGDHKREVEAFCQLYGINVIHSPERAPRTEKEA